MRGLDELAFETPVTFFVGENGCGKSTLLEALASGMGAHAIGASDVGDDPTLAGPRALAETYAFARTATPRVKAFFRAEDAFGFSRRVQGDMAELRVLEARVRADPVASEAARARAAGSIGAQRREFERRYGADPHAASHGETFLAILQNRLVPGGLYFLDEPETPFSPVRVLALLALVLDAVDAGSQFVIATHSPILMALPGARLFVFDGERPRSVPFDEVEHVALTRQILANPASFVRRLRDD
ncbi:MAG: AAA family ATPase [Vulcanimicrobiaceae bacterium]